MAKNKYNKKDRKLRQSIEVLKAQLKIDETPKMVEVQATAKKSTTRQIDTKIIKADLRKTIILSVLAFGIIIALNAFNINPF